VTRSTTGVPQKRPTADNGSTTIPTSLALSTPSNRAQRSVSPGETGANGRPPGDRLPGLHDRSSARRGRRAERPVCGVVCNIYSANSRTLQKSERFHGFLGNSFSPVAAGPHRPLCGRRTGRSAGLLATDHAPRIKRGRRGLHHARPHFGGEGECPVHNDRAIRAAASGAPRTRLGRRGRGDRTLVASPASTLAETDPTKTPHQQRAPMGLCVSL
jgi:hypothetical protein